MVALIHRLVPKTNIPKENDEAAQSELQEYLQVNQQRRWIFPRAALVGLFAGISAFLFRAALAGADALRNKLIAWAHGLGNFGWIIPVVITMAGTVAAVYITRRIAPEAAGSGIPHIEAVLHRFKNMDWKRILPVKFIGGVIAIGTGLTLGREGPTVQMGGAVGDATARMLKTTERERLTLISAGAGAGLAAAFNAPLSGLIFILEEVRRDFQPIVFGATFVAAVIADIIARIGAGQFPVFSVPTYPVLPLASLPIFAVLGILAGFLGVFFNRTLLGTMNLFKKIPQKWIYIILAVVGGLIGLIGWFNPDLVGSGHSLVDSVLKGQVILSMIPLLLLARFFMTTTSYSTGAPGGIFAPLLVLGALVGLAVGKIGNYFLPAVITLPEVFAVVGMAALFAAVVRAPLTGLMLIIEMTGSYAQMLPLLVSCFFAYIIAEWLKELPVYEALLERDLSHNKAASSFREPAVMDFIVQAESPFTGRLVRDLGLPAGCILIRCSDGKKEWVPKATTRIEPHMRITVVVAPEAMDGVEVLHKGFTRVN
jgi:CIC family chloride channel protein